MKLPVRIVVAALLLGLMPLSLSAQRAERRVFVAATAASGAPVLNLTRADLRVTENGSPREVTGVTLGTAPLRIVLLVDSSTAIGPLINSFRAALNAFVDAIPDEHEITFISTGGQIRVRTRPTTDRQSMQMEIARFASDGGANAFLDTLIEADRRFLKTAPGQWPVIVIVTTDNGETRREMPIDGDHAARTRPGHRRATGRRSPEDGEQVRSAVHGRCQAGATHGQRHRHQGRRAAADVATPAVLAVVTRWGTPPFSSTANRHKLTIFQRRRRRLFHNHSRLF